MSRKYKRTRARDKRFFDALETGATIGEAAKYAGYSRRSIYHYADEDPIFAKDLDDAKQDLIEKLEKEADRRAIEGVVDYKSLKVTKDGKNINKIVQIRKYSDPLLQFRLRRLDPEHYRDNYKKDEMPDDFESVDLDVIIHELGETLKAFIDVEVNDDSKDHTE